MDLKTSIIILLVAAVGLAASASSGLKVKFGTGTSSHFNVDFFYDIPHNVTKAQAVGWSQLKRPSGAPFPALVLYCLGLPELCVLYDDTGSVAGLQIGLSNEYFGNNTYTKASMGLKKWTPKGLGTYWIISQYFVTEEFLSKTADERIQSRNSNNLLQLDGVWLQHNSDTLLKVPYKETDLKGSLWTEQGCITWMGRHYYYNMSADLQCSTRQSESNIFPWFPLYDDGQLIGVGLNIFGTLVKTDRRYWFENPDRSATKMIVPRGPECLYDLADTPGIVTMHTYYIERPWLVTCP